MRLAANESVVAARGLLMELAMHRLSAELDDVRKQQDATKWTDAQLVLAEKPVRQFSLSTALADGRRRTPPARTGRAGDSPIVGGERATESTESIVAGDRETGAN